jgi:hypothetical protein
MVSDEFAEANRTKGEDHSTDLPRNGGDRTAISIITLDSLQM